MAVDVPAGFGNTTCAWPLTRTVDPAELRAKYLHHRVVVAARAFMGEQAETRDFARLLGDESANGLAKTRRKLSGETPLSVVELARWSDLFHVDLSTITGRTAEDPEAYPPLYRALIIRDGGRVRFRRRNELDWPDVTARTHQALAVDLACDAAMVTDDVVRLRLHEALRDSGFDPALIRVTPHGVTLLINEPVDVEVRAAATDDDETWANIRRAVAVSDHATIYMALGATAIARLEGLVPELFVVEVGQFVEPSWAAFEGHVAPDQDPCRAWQVHSRVTGDGLTLVALRQKR